MPPQQPPYWGPPLGSPPHGAAPYAGQPHAGPRHPEYPATPEARPAGVLGAAVLGWIVAGLLLLAAGLLFFGAAFLRDVDTASAVRDAYVAEFTVDAFLDLIAAGLLAAGGVALISRAARGRMLLSAGGAIVLVEAVYWLIRWTSRSGGTVVGYAVLFASLAVAAAAFAWSQPVTNWLSRR
jgi:hypothetical protein